MDFTIYAETCPNELKTRPFTWPRFERIERVYGAVRNGSLELAEENRASSENGCGIEVVAYKGAVGTNADSLPTEFFNHQLLDYDPMQEESVHDFLSAWGLLFSPSREHESCFECWDESFYKADANAKKFTAQVEERYRSIGIVSLSEASLALRALQRIGNDMMALLRDEATSLDVIDRLTSVLEAASIHPLELNASIAGISAEMHTRAGLRSRGLLVSAICNQIIDAIDDPAKWRECACDGCTRIFKRKQSKFPRHDSDSKYCCDKCMEIQKKRNQRKSAKNRIKH